MNQTKNPKYRKKNGSKKSGWTEKRSEEKWEEGRVWKAENGNRAGKQLLIFQPTVRKWMSASPLLLISLHPTLRCSSFMDGTSSQPLTCWVTATHWRSKARRERERRHEWKACFLNGDVVCCGRFYENREGKLNSHSYYVGLDLLRQK